MVGDGSYMMLHSELQPRCRRGSTSPFCCLIMPASAALITCRWGHGMGSFGTENRHRNPDSGRLDGPLVKVDFAQNAEAMAAARGGSTTSRVCWRRWRRRGRILAQRCWISKCCQKP
ncbi:hypothetical protein [Enterobacter ludwigii]|uniref:hypothetical protein n=1 Tax=Enterobacter ludwigii TaxID=299767 RepID=UPI003D23CFFB